MIEQDCVLIKKSTRRVSCAGNAVKPAKIRFIIAYPYNEKSISAYSPVSGPAEFEII